MQQLWEEGLEAGKCPMLAPHTPPGGTDGNPRGSGAQAGAPGPTGFQPDPFPSLTLAACLVSEQSRRLGET